jgi:hypothetical protein
VTNRATRVSKWNCITASAISTVLQHVVDNEVGEITLTSPTAAGVTRKWTRLQD